MVKDFGYSACLQKLPFRRIQMKDLNTIRTNGTRRELSVCEILYSNALSSDLLITAWNTWIGGKKLVYSVERCTKANRQLQNTVLHASVDRLVRSQGQRLRSGKRVFIYVPVNKHICIRELQYTRCEGCRCWIFHASFFCRPWTGSTLVTSPWRWNSSAYKSFCSHLSRVKMGKTTRELFSSEAFLDAPMAETQGRTDAVFISQHGLELQRKG